jgi:VanW like protein
MGTYRRGIALSRARRQLVVLAAVGLCLLTVSPSLPSAQARSGPGEAELSVLSPGDAMVLAPALTIGPILLAPPTDLPVNVLTDLEVPGLEDEVAIEAVSLPLVVADARASTAHLDDPGLFNALNAIGFVDGTVLPAGARFVFDDVARTWDYREDPSYVPGRATSVRGFITMRGGGVCAVSTAGWRAALDAGLRTDRRQPHSGLIQPDYAGVDATNTLIVANDTQEALTLHVWLDGDEVRAQLLADGDLGRSATVTEPQRVGNGRWLVEQHITRDDGTGSVNRFLSQYYW